MKTDWGIVLAVLFTGVVAFFLGVIIARVFPSGDPKPLTDLMIAAVGALAGTAAGAWIALHGDRQRRSQEREERNVMAANIAILQLGRVMNYLDQYTRDVINPDRTTNLRWFLMARKILKASDNIRVDIGTLGFLFASADANVPNDVGVEFERFEQILSMIDQVKRLLEQAHARMEELRIIEGATPQEIEGACGRRIVTPMKSLTDSIVDHVDRSSVSVLATARRVHAATRAMYPDSRVISFAAKTAVVES